MWSVPTLGNTYPDDEDVLQEENIVKQQHREGFVDPNLAVQIHGLEKVYPGRTNIGCCNCKRSAPYHALKVQHSFFYALVKVYISCKLILL